MPRTSIRLPYGIVVERVSHVCTRLTSELRLEFVDSSIAFDAYGELATHVMESLLVALVTEGVELDSPAASRAVTSAAENVAEYLARLDD